MVCVSAYLIRQVASGGGTTDFTKNYINRMKQAVLSGNLRSFIEDLHVILSPDGQDYQLIKNSGNVSHAYNPYTADREGEGWNAQGQAGRWSKGASAVMDAEYGVAACLYYNENSDYSHINGTWVDSISDSVVYVNYQSRPGEGSGSSFTWTNTEYSDNYITKYRNTALCTIPIFANYAAALIHVERVLRYCSSKQDSDLEDVESNMLSNLYDYEYESL